MVGGEAWKKYKMTGNHRALGRPVLGSLLAPHPCPFQHHQCGVTIPMSTSFPMRSSFIFDPTFLPYSGISTGAENPEIIPAKKWRREKALRTRVLERLATRVTTMWVAQPFWARAMLLMIGQGAMQLVLRTPPNPPLPPPLRREVTLLPTGGLEAVDFAGFSLKYDQLLPGEGCGSR